MKLVGKANAQGVIAQVRQFSYVHLEDFLCREDIKKYTIVALSNLTDPQNLGSILRTLACLGKFAVLIPRHRSVSVTDTVLKVACGGENYVPVIQVTNLVPALEQLKKEGFWVAGAVVDEGEDLSEVKLVFPLCLVIGSEGEGIRKGILDKLDFKVTMPMQGAVLSLNAAVATAVFCYEISCRRKLKG